MGHAGAIATRGRGSTEEKIKAFRKRRCGVPKVREK